MTEGETVQVPLAFDREHAYLEPPKPAEFDRFRELSSKDLTGHTIQVYV
jgi:hypothetical protein